MTNETIILKQNGNELVKADLQFIILTNGKRYDGFVYNSYLSAKIRLEKLQRILKHSTHEILVIEG